jgi:flagellar hook-associated protein 2
MTNLLSPLGVKSSGNLVMQVFSSAMSNLREKMNQDIFSQESQAALTSFYENISSLTIKTKKLIDSEPGSVFFDRTATSSNLDVLTGTAMDALSQRTGATEGRYEFIITQIAQAQENIGIELNPDEDSLADVGTNVFSITINGEDNPLSIEIEDSDTNDDLLQKLASTINLAGLGLEAEVRIGESGETESLVIQADETGQAGAFTISDVSGNAIEATGVVNETTSAQNLNYSLNGESNSAGSNMIFINGGKVTVDIHAVGEATLTIAPDNNLVKNAITNLVSEFNSFINFLEDSSKYIKDDVLRSLNGYISNHKTDLNSIGLSLNDDGSLAVDSDTLNQMIEKDLSKIKELFSGFDGMANQLNQYANNITLDSPLNYMKEAEGLADEFKTLIYSSSALMIQQLLQGKMFDRYA